MSCFVQYSCLSPLQTPHVGVLVQWWRGSRSWSQLGQFWGPEHDKSNLSDLGLKEVGVIQALSTPGMYPQSNLSGVQCSPR